MLCCDLGAGSANIAAVDDAPVSPGSPPELSWDGLCQLHARTRRPEPWTEAIGWAVDVLRTTLGEDWAIKASTRDRRPPLWSALVSAMSHTIAAAEALERALRLRLLADLDGTGDVRRDLSRDVTVGRGLHTQVQLEVAGHANRLGWLVRLEPSGSSSPGDVEFDAPTGMRITVEIKSLAERDRTRDERQEITALTDRSTLPRCPGECGWQATSVGCPRRTRRSQSSTGSRRQNQVSDGGYGRLTGLSCT